MGIGRRRTGQGHVECGPDECCGDRSRFPRRQRNLSGRINNSLKERADHPEHGADTSHDDDLDYSLNDLDGRWPFTDRSLATWLWMGRGLTLPSLRWRGSFLRERQVTGRTSIVKFQAARCARSCPQPRLSPCRTMVLRVARDPGLFSEREEGGVPRCQSTRVAESWRLCSRITPRSPSHDASQR
jgi:hypothetical protein